MKKKNRYLQLFVRATIVLLLVLLSSRGWKRAEKISRSQYNTQKIMDPSRLLEIVTTLSQDIGIRDFQHYSNLNSAADYIVQQFEDMGYEPHIQEYKIDNQVFKNIIVHKPGLNSSKGTVIVGAHYDTCSNSGADDNASGIAGVLELARAIKEEQLTQDIKFIAFVNEEPPFFQTDQMGSRVYAKKAREEEENIKAVIILEMIGYYTEEANTQEYPPLLGFFYPNKGNFIAFVSNLKSNELNKKMVNYFKESTDFPLESLTAPELVSGVGFSDHSSFWKEDFPAMMVTDTAFFRNQHYHQMTDLPKTLDYEKMAALLAGLKETIIKVANEK